MDNTDRETVELADTLRALQRTPGFAWLKAEAQRYVDEIIQTLITPQHRLGKDNPHPSAEYLRGAIHGLGYCFSKSGSIISQAQEINSREEKDTTDE